MTPNQYLGTLCKRGHDHTGTKQSLRFCTGGACVVCMRLWNRQNKEYNRRKRQRYREDLFYRAIDAVRGRCRISGAAFSLTREYLRELWDKQEGRCYWLNIALESKPGNKHHPQKATVDRLDPSLGYTPGNVVWASSFANLGRNDLPAAEFLEFLTTNNLKSATESP